MEIRKILLTFACIKDRYFFSQIQKYVIIKLPIFLTLDEARDWLQTDILTIRLDIHKDTGEEFLLGDVLSCFRDVLEVKCDAFRLL